MNLYIHIWVSFVKTIFKKRVFCLRCVPHRNCNYDKNINISVYIGYKRLQVLNKTLMFKI